MLGGWIPQGFITDRVEDSLSWVRVRVGWGIHITGIIYNCCTCCTIFLSAVVKHLTRDIARVWARYDIISEVCCYLSVNTK